MMAAASLGQRDARPAPRSNYHVEPWANATAAWLADGPVAVSMGYPSTSFAPLADADASVRVLPLRAMCVTPGSLLSHQLRAHACVATIGRSRHVLSC
jgi:hypothetical protein